MQYIRQFICLVLLITTPAGFIYPQDYSIEFYHREIPQRKPLKDLSLLTYDKILELLDEIEFGGLEERCSFEELENINRFLATLAIEGAQDSDTALEDDVVDLVSAGNIYQNARLFDDQAYVIYPLVFYGDSNIILCKSFWKKTKDFVKNHKKEIIIGAVIVVAVVAVVTVAVVATSAAAASTAAAAAGTVAASENNQEPYKQHQLESKTEEEDANARDALAPMSVEQVSLLKQELHEHFEPIKELATEEYDPSFCEKAREFGSHLTHEALDSISDLASLGPQLQQELVDLSAKIFPESMVPGDMKNPMENYDNQIAKGHDKIDQIFSTNQAEYHTGETRADRSGQFDIGILPPPGTFLPKKNIGRLIDLPIRQMNEFKEAGKALDRADFTLAGRSLMKKGYREGSVFPKPVGNQTQINQHGQSILEEILNDPNKRVYQIENGDIKIYNHEGRGAYFKKNGKFRGFIEEQYE